MEGNAADVCTQTLRLKQLRGKKVLWVTAPCIPGMSQGLRDSAKWAVDRGAKVVVLAQTEEDRVFKIMKEAGLAAGGVFANLDSEDACANVVEALRREGITPDAVFSPYEWCQTLVGELVDALGLPGNSGQSYKIARSKHLARLATAAAGLATPKSAVAFSKEEVESVCDIVGFPCIVKPSSGAGSCGVVRATSVQQVHDAYDNIKKDAEENDILSYNPGVKVGVLLEQFLEGDEFDCDMLVWDGKLVYAQCVYNWPCMAPYFLETGTNMPAPSRFSEEQLESMKEYSFACVKAMNFKQGAFHVELMLTKDGPVLIEVNARQGGGPNQIFNVEMHGVNIFGNYFMSACGIPINPPRVENKYFMADYAITPRKTGRLVDDSHMDLIRAHPNVVQVTDFVKPGGKVSGLDSGFPAWINQFVVKGDSAEHCTRIVHELLDDIDSRINLEPLVELSVKEVESATQLAPQDSPKAVDDNETA